MAYITETLPTNGGTINFKWTMSGCEGQLKGTDWVITEDPATTSGNEYFTTVITEAAQTIEVSCSSATTSSAHTITLTPKISGTPCTGRSIVVKQDGIEPTTCSCVKSVTTNDVSCGGGDNYVFAAVVINSDSSCNQSKFKLYDASGNAVSASYNLTTKTLNFYKTFTETDRREDWFEGYDLYYDGEFCQTISVKRQGLKDCCDCHAVVNYSITPLKLSFPYTGNTEVMFASGDIRTECGTIEMRYEPNYQSRTERDGSKHYFYIKLYDDEDPNIYGANFDIKKDGVTQECPYSIFIYQCGCEITCPTYDLDPYIVLGKKGAKQGYIYQTSVEPWGDIVLPGCACEMTESNYIIGLNNGVGGSGCWKDIDYDETNIMPVGLTIKRVTDNGSYDINLTTCNDCNPIPSGGGMGAQYSWYNLNAVIDPSTDNYGTTQRSETYAIQYSHDMVKKSDSNGRTWAKGGTVCYEKNLNILQDVISGCSCSDFSLTLLAQSTTISSIYLGYHMYKHEYSVSGDCYQMYDDVNNSSSSVPAANRRYWIDTADTASWVTISPLEHRTLTSYHGTDCRGYFSVLAEDNPNSGSTGSRSTYFKIKYKDPSGSECEKKIIITQEAYTPPTPPTPPTPTACTCYSAIAYGSTVGPESASQIQLASLNVPSCASPEEDILVSWDGDWIHDGNDEGPTFTASVNENTTTEERTATVTFQVVITGATGVTVTSTTCTKSCTITQKGQQLKPTKCEDLSDRTVINFGGGIPVGETAIVGYLDSDIDPSYVTIDAGSNGSSTWHVDHIDSDGNVWGYGAAKGTSGGWMSLSIGGVECNYVTGHIGVY